MQLVHTTAYCRAIIVLVFSILPIVPGSENSCQRLIEKRVELEFEVEGVYLKVRRNVLDTNLRILELINAVLAQTEMHHLDVTTLVQPYYSRYLCIGFIDHYIHLECNTVH